MQLNLFMQLNWSMCFVISWQQLTRFKCMFCSLLICISEKQQKEEREENIHTVSIFSLTHAQVEIRVVLRSVTGEYQTMGEKWL